MKTIFVIAVIVAALASSCSMPNIEDPNSLRARVLGTPQAAQVQAQPTAAPAPTSEPTTPSQQAAPVQLAGAVVDVVTVDPNSADPFEVARAAVMAIGGVIGFYLFAVGVHALITRRAHG